MQELLDRARGDLVVALDGGGYEYSIWEHGCRVADLTAVILHFSEVRHYAVDRQALTAAALYHDAGWVWQLQRGQVQPLDVLLRPTSPEQRELALNWLPQRLAGILEPGALKVAARIIRESPSRQSSLPEAHILGDAENLDEIGPQAVWLMVRRQLAEGRSLEDMIHLWQRQELYQFWPARISEGLIFPSSRVLAEKRLRVLRSFMNELIKTCGTVPPRPRA